MTAGALPRRCLRRLQGACLPGGFKIAFDDDWEHAVRRANTKTTTPPSAVVGSPVPKAGRSHRKETRLLNVLLIGVDKTMASLVAEVAPSAGFTIHHAAGIGAAQAELTRREMDMTLIQAQLADGSGLALARELMHRRQPVPSVIVADKPSVDTAVQAIRAGAIDYLTLPMTAQELKERIEVITQRLRTQQRNNDKVRRLRRMCHKLSTSREEISQQVNVLCGDLVAAYQDLADQMHHVLESTEFNAVIRNELDLEQLVRKSMEYVLDKVGPTNAAIFLPSSADEYSLGGYVNYDCQSQPSEILLQQMADVVAPRVSEQEGVVHLTDDAGLRGTFGEDFDLLKGDHLVAVTCRHEDESLAILTVFRDASEPFDDNVVEMLAAVSSSLGTALARIIRVHHRGNPAALE